MAGPNPVSILNSGGPGGNPPRALDQRDLVPGGILGGQRDLPPRRRTSGHAGTVARRRHHVACYQASSLRLGQWILERKTPW